MYDGQFAIDVSTAEITQINATLYIPAGKTTLADAWSTRSSRELKENIIQLSPESFKISPNLYKYNLKADQNKKQRIGLMAEEVPQECLEDNGGVDNYCLISITYAKIALQEQQLQERQNQIDELTSLLQKENRVREKSIMALQEEVRKLQRGEGSLKIEELKPKPQEPQTP